MSKRIKNHPILRRAKIAPINEGVIKRQILGMDDNFKAKGIEDMSDEMTSHNVAAAFSEIYTSVSDSRKTMIREVDRMNSFYLVNTIVTQIVEDSLAPDTSTENILDVSSNNKQIQNAIDDLSDRIDFDQLIKDITPDLVRYGEYTLRNIFVGDDSEMGNIEKDEKGIGSVVDDVDQSSVVSLTKNGKITGHLIFDHEKGRISRKASKKYTKFTLDGERVRIELEKFIPSSYLQREEVKKILEDIPRFIRVGKSYIFPVLPKIKELELMEKLVPATKLNKLSGGSMVGMQLPESYSIDEALNATKRLESIINNKIVVNDDLEEITVQAIMSTAGRIKVLPVFGEKGSLQKMDYKSDEPDDLLNSVKEIRKVILDSIGIPYELIFSSEGEGKAEILKRYAKYLRRLKNIQRALAKGIRELIKVHLLSSGFEDEFNDDDINVKFINTLVDIDNVDKLEHMDVTVGMLQRLTAYIEENLMGESSSVSEFIDIEVYKNYLKEHFSSIGMPGLISDKKINIRQNTTSDKSDEE